LGEAALRLRFPDPGGLLLRHIDDGSIESGLTLSLAFWEHLVPKGNALNVFDPGRVKAISR
jgi:hypothetical protein